MCRRPGAAPVQPNECLTLAKDFAEGRRQLERIEGCGHNGRSIGSAQALHCVFIYLRREEDRRCLAEPAVRAKGFKHLRAGAITKQQEVGFEIIDPFEGCCCRPELDHLHSADRDEGQLDDPTNIFAIIDVENSEHHSTQEGEDAGADTGTVSPLPCGDLMEV